jgi:hypothetical protein
VRWWLTPGAAVASRVLNTLWPPTYKAYDVADTWLDTVEEEQEVLEPAWFCPDCRSQVLPVDGFPGATFCRGCPNMWLPSGALVPQKSSVSASDTERPSPVEGVILPDATTPGDGHSLNHLEASVQDVLGNHEYKFGDLTNCTCGCYGVWDWRDWRDHVAPLLSKAVQS